MQPYTPPSQCEFEFPDRPTSKQSKYVSIFVKSRKTSSAGVLEYHAVHTVELNEVSHTLVDDTEVRVCLVLNVGMACSSTGSRPVQFEFGETLERLRQFVDCACVCVRQALEMSRVLLRCPEEYDEKNGI